MCILNEYVYRNLPVCGLFDNILTSFYSKSESAVEFQVGTTSLSLSDEEDTAGTPDFNGDDNSSDDGKLL